MRRLAHATLVYRKPPPMGMRLADTVSNIRPCDNARFAKNGPSAADPDGP